MNEPSTRLTRPDPATAAVIYLCAHSAKAVWMTERSDNPHRAIVRAMTAAQPLASAIGLSGLDGCVDVVLPKGWCLQSTTVDTDDFDFESEISAGIRYSIDCGDVGIDAVVVCDIDILPLLPEGMQKKALLDSLVEQATADLDLRSVDGRDDSEEFDYRAPKHRHLDFVA